MLERAKPAPIAGLPAWVTHEVIAETRAVFEPLYGHTLSNDDITEIVVNTDQMFRLLYGDRRGREASNEDATVPDRGPGRRRKQQAIVLDKSDGALPPASVEGSGS